MFFHLDQITCARFTSANLHMHLQLQGPLRMKNPLNTVTVGMRSSISSMHMLHSTLCEEHQMRQGGLLD